MRLNFKNFYLSNKLIIWLSLIIIFSIGLYNILYNYNVTKIVFNKYIKGFEDYGGNYLAGKYKNFQVKPKYKVVFITSCCADATYAEYFKYAATQIGWEVQVYSPNFVGYENDILNFDPDIILIAELAIAELANFSFHNIKISSHRSKKYFISLGGSLEDYLNTGVLQVKKNKLMPRKHLEAILTSVHGVISISRKSLKVFERIFSDMDKSFFGIELLATPPGMAYHKPAEPRSLIWLGRWEYSSSNSKNNTKFIKILSKYVPIRVYGFYNSYIGLHKELAYGGFIPYGIENIEAIRKNGIYLLTHSTSHFKDNTPSMRVFEAAAANSVIISDLHPFVVNNFGDSVLYFDQNASPELRAKQVKDHVDWILKNPSKAKELAKKANQIFLDKFSLDQDYLISLAKMHEAVLDYEKQLGLPYNLVY